MRRRALLRALPPAAVGLTGCAARGPPSGSDGSPTTDGGGPSLVGADLRVRANDCGQQVDAARASFDAERPAVVVEGTIWGSDTCHTARLADATYDPADDLLAVHVTAVRRETTGTPACGQCIVEVDYTATCTFAGGLPGTVRVVHGTGDRRTVVTAAERP